jgi:EAL domain-containing protein (putative c-di-GMP-specific phosphodiesterase class I)/CheY-like chemotaxis protein
VPEKLLDDLQDWLWKPGDGNQDQPAAQTDGAQSPSRAAFIIDDEEGICKFIAMTLANWGVEAESFHTADRALEALDRRIPAIIFLDIALKKSDAIDVIRGLGERGYNGVVQIMSGSNPTLLDDVRRIGVRHGLKMRPPLQKPFRIEAVRQAFNGAQLDQKPAAVSNHDTSVSLDDALENDWLELWYQPKIDLRTRLLAGAEGLIRCRHPVHGVLTPASFLPGASDKGLLALTEHVVLTALRDWEIIAALGVYPHIAVNTSLSALASLHLPTLIREHRPKDDKWPGLILEVTESDVAKDIALAHEIATQLCIYGITIAIDDFGEGYSSFARLRELPFGELKLDRSFVNNCAHDAQNAGICQAIIELAHHFGALAVAEGLETAADLKAIQKMGCDIGQGFFFARAMPKSQFIPMLRDRALRKQAS